MSSSPLPPSRQDGSDEVQQAGTMMPIIITRTMMAAIITANALHHHHLYDTLPTVSEFDSNQTTPSHGDACSLPLYHHVYPK